MEAKKTPKGKREKRRPAEGEGGWTFIETLIVISIILILTSSVGFTAVKYLDKAKAVAARSQIETFALGVDAYFFDCGRYPSDLEGLDALWEKQDSTLLSWNGPYINKPVPADPWGNRYAYTVPGFNDMPYGIRCFGRDGAEGGEGNDADICSWE
ncbi:MAG: type II secretion system major pseudopilin GspG [Treponema sp.]|jgi:general secretion pathway protein G|nr:type II secretion system major pseudopilin GspG [Treponema sp.]